MRHLDHVGPFRLAFLLLLLVGALAAPSTVVEAQDKKGKKGKKDDREPAGGSAAADQGGKATLVLEDGRSREGVDVKEEKFALIKFRDRGRAEEIEGAKVVAIEYEDAPGQFLAGQSQLRASLFERAVQSFSGARNTAAEGTWLWFHATYYLGESMRQAGQAAEAIAEYQRLLEKGADHWLAPAAIFGLGQAQIAAERHDNAAATFKRLDTGFGDLWGFRGKLGEGDALYAQKKYGPARGAYETAEKGATRYASIRRIAQVGIGKCYIADKRYDDAVRYFENIINATGGVDPEVGGGAWVGIGDCRFEQAKANQDDRTKLVEALIAYQTASTRYAGVPGAYPRALFQSAIIYRKLNLPDLAKHQADELKSRYPKSPYVKQLGE